MATKRDTNFYFLIDRSLIERMGVVALMDMLRYDSATVCSNPPGGFYLLKSAHTPTEGRWSSFGVPVYRVQKGSSYFAGEIEWNTCSECGLVQSNGHATGCSRVSVTRSASKRS